jgi:hypothetical protein
MSAAQSMRKLRADRKAAGLIEFRCWLTPEQKDLLLGYVMPKAIRDTVTPKRERLVELRKALLPASRSTSTNATQANSK